MNDAYELLRTKERELALVRKEIAALRVVAPLLSETNDAETNDAGDSPIDEDHSRDPAQFDSQGSNSNTQQDDPLQDSFRLLFQSSPPKRGRIRDWLDRVVGE